MLDLPITSQTDDEFGHAAIASYLSSYICKPKSNDGVIIAVTGAWGTGKSGILNLLCKKLDEGSIRFTDEFNNEFFAKPSYFRFQPWLVGSRDALIGSFFAELVKEIDKIEAELADDGGISRGELKQLTRRLRGQIANFASLASAAAEASSFLDPTGAAALVSAGLSFFSKAAPVGAAARSLEQERREIEDSLSELSVLRGGLRFVVVIDDIDRLEPDEVVELFRLVKAVADFQHITYLLAFDQRVVERAIKESLRVESGGAFLEKLIQFSVPVPPLTSRALPQWFERQLQNAFPPKLDSSGKQVDELDFGSRRASVVLRGWAGRLLRTPRDVKRLIASIEFIWAELRGKGDLLDVVWIEMLKVRASSGDGDLYSWVRDYMASVEEISLGAKAVGVTEQAEALDSILLNLGWKAGKMMQAGVDPADTHYLNIMLPGISRSYVETGKTTGIYSFGNPPEWRKFIPECRLGSPRHWHVYFALQPPTTSVLGVGNRGLADATAAGGDTLTQFVRELLSNTAGVNKADQILFDWLEPNIDSFSPWDAKAWIAVIVELAEAFDKNSPGVVTPDRTNFAIRQRRLLSRLMRLIPAEERRQFFVNLAAQGKSIWSLVDFIRSEIALHDKREENPSSFEIEHVFEPFDLNPLQFALSSRLRRMTWEELASSVEPWAVLFGWLDVGDKEGAQEWFEEQFSHNDRIVERLEVLITNSWGEGPIPHLRANYIAHFTNESLLRQRLQTRVAGDRPDAAKAQHLLNIWEYDKD